MKRSWLLSCIVLPLVSACEDPAGPSVVELEQSIVGGSEARAGDIPWQAALFGVADAKTPPVQFCGGTLVDAKAGWVVTAAHCVVLDDLSATEAAPTRVLGPKSLRVAIGALRLSEVKPEQYLRVRAVYVHPNWDADTIQNDIALLAVDGVNPRTPTPRLAGTRSRDRRIGPGRWAIASGWGSVFAESPEIDDESSAATGTAPSSDPDVDGLGYPDTLRWASLPIVSNEQCAVADADPEDPESALTEDMLCAGLRRGGRDTCSGDSGGPLVVMESARAPVLVGVTSWGPGCAWPGYYGVYTRVSSYASWLEGCMTQSSACGLPRVQ